MMLTISHEIKNPLTLMNSTLQLLSYNHPELMEDNLWLQLLDDMDYLKDLVNSLFAYESDEDLDRTSIDVDKFLSGVTASWQPFAYEENKNLTMDIEDNLPPLTCDPLKLKQVMINMIKNAFEATDEHGIIEVSAKLRLKRIVIIVSDNGHGIPEDQLPNIFDFMTSYKKGGSGIGLAHCKKIIEAHGGTIRVASKAGEGTKFIIILPLAGNRSDC